MGEQPWYIDAMDGLGGLGFASQRAASTAGDAASVDRSTLFFSAPDFHVLRVSNSALALAATRGSLQLGLFGTTGEIRFGSPEDIAEFLRRCYVRGGRSGPGGGPGEGGPGQGGDDGHGGPETPQELGNLRVDGTLGSMFNAHTRKVDAFAASRDKANGGFGVPYAWGQSTTTESQQTEVTRPLYTDGWKCLAQGALEISWELLHRLPRSRDEFHAWHLTAYTLGTLMCRIGVWSKLQKSLALHPRLLPHQPSWFRNDDAFERVAEAFGGQGPYWELRGFTEMDPMDLLEILPAPRGLLPALGDTGNIDATLLNLLSAYLANPVLLDRSPRLFDVILFAAFLIAAPPRGDVHWDLGRFGGYEVVALAASRAADTAKTWLDEQLPRRVFGADVENLIQQVGSPNRAYSGNIRAR